MDSLTVEMENNDNKRCSVVDCRLRNKYSYLQEGQADEQTVALDARGEAVAGNVEES